MKLLRQAFVSGVLVFGVAIAISAQPANYKFAFIERLATEKFGGSRDMAVGPDGAIYVAGSAPGIELPVVGPPIVDQRTLKPEAFGPSYIQKYDSDGNLLYASYVNACGARKIRVIDEENIYISGHFAHDDCSTEGAYRVQDAQGGAFVTKLNLRTHKIVYSVAIGGSEKGSTEAFGLDVTTRGEVVIAGYTESKNFPTTSDAFQRRYDPAKEFEESGFVSKLSADGSRLRNSTYLSGASESTMVRGLVIGRNDEIYVTGWTRAYKFPTTRTYGDTNQDSGAAFVTRLSPDLHDVIFSTKFRGGGASGSSIAVGPDATVYVSGAVYDDFPTTAGVYQQKLKGDDYHVFVLGLTPDGVLKFSTVLGGKGDSTDNQMLIGPDSRIYVVGSTWSRSFPVTKNAYQGSYEGGIKRFDLGETFKTALYDHPPNDGFLSVLSPNATALLYSTYLGGTDSDSIGSVGIDNKSNIYIQGYAESKRFPQLNPKTKYDRGDGTYFLAKLVIN